MGRDDEAAVLGAFRACFTADLASGRPRAVAFYQRMFAGFDDAVAREYARLDAADAAPRPAPAPPPREEAETIGPYRVVSELGRGAQGTVFLAQDTRVDRKVALKVLAPAYASSPQMLRRFRREAEAASKLDHPGICAVYDTDVDGPTPWIAMRYVAGRTLAQVIADSHPADAADSSLASRSSIVSLPALKSSDPGAPAAQDGKPSLARLLAFFEESARALHVAHEAGLVHRDVKPGNVIVAEDGRPVILDFGLAQDGDEGGRLTETGTLMGTPAYMSPEQLLAQRVQLDRRTDVYSLGASLYECLTLRLPFQAPTREALYQMILSSEPPKLRRLNRAISRDLEVVVETAMAKDRGRRYQTAADFAEDLRRVRAQEPIRARPAGALTRLSRWAQRKPALAASLAVIFVLLAGGLAVTIVLLRRSEDDRAEATKSRADAEQALREKIAETKSKDEALARSRALNLVHESAAAAGTDPMLSLLLAREAMRVAPLPQAITQVHDALSRTLEAAELRGHRGVVFSACFSPGGDAVATAGADGTARMFDLNGKELAVFAGHEDLVWSAEFSPSGARVLTASSDGTARVWDLRGTQLAVLRHDSPVEVAEYSPAGDRIVTLAHDRKARLWDAAGAVLCVLGENDGPVYCVGFSPAGDRIATASEDGAVHLWDASGRRLSELRGHDGAVWLTRFSRAGDRLLSVGVDRTVRVWDAQGKQALLLEPGGGDKSVYVTHAQISPSGDRVVVSAVKAAFVYDLQGRQLCRLEPTNSTGDAVMAARFSPTGDGTVLTYGYDAAARLWNADGRPIAELRPHDGRVTQGQFSPDGKSVVTTSYDGVARLWRYPAGEDGIAHLPAGERTSDESDSGLIARITADGAARLRDLNGELVAEFHASAKCYMARIAGVRVMTQDVEGRTQLWDSSGHDIASLPAPGWTSCFDATPDGRVVVVASQDGTVCVCDGEGRETARFTTPPTAFNCVGAMLLPDGRGVVLPMADSTLRLYDLEGRELLVMRGHQGLIDRIAIARGGDRAATSAADGSTIVWNLSTGHRLAFFASAGDPNFSPDGARLVTTTHEGAVRVYDHDLREVFSLPGSLDVRSARFTAAGDTLFTVSGDGTIRRWFASEEKLMTTAAARTVRTFTHEERVRYADLLPAEDPPVAALRRRVDEIHDACGFVDDLVDRVRADASISDAERPAALEMASNYADDPLELNLRSWMLVRLPGASADDARLAVRLSRAACRAAPWNWGYVNTLGVALCRAGEYAKALSTLRQSDAMNKGALGGDMAALAIVLHRLGREPEAREELTRAREQMKKPGEDKNPDFVPLFREAESLIEGAAPGK